MDGEQQVQFHKNKRADIVNKVVEEVEEKLETHFVENPFIKLREKADKKSRDSKVILASGDLEMDAEKDRDIYIMQDTGKIYVNDLEKKQRDKKEKKGGNEESESDTDDEAVAKRGSNSREIKKSLKTYNLQKRSSVSTGI